MPLIILRFRRNFPSRWFIGIAASIDTSCSAVSQDRFDPGSLPTTESVESGNPEPGLTEIEFGT